MTPASSEEDKYKKDILNIDFQYLSPYEPVIVLDKTICII